MEIKYFRSLWGMHLPTIEENIVATHEAGFDGIEYIALPDDAERHAFGKQLKTNDLDFILQIGTGAGTGPSIGPESNTEHLRTLEREFRLGVDLNPIFVNAHSGRDIFSHAQNAPLFEKSKTLEKENQLLILHETHRGRATATLPTTLELIRQFPSLKLTADFSHWTCAHESMLQDQEEALAEILPRVHHIHARVGSEQSPQIDDPRAVEHKQELEIHLEWWKRIIRHRRESGSQQITITVEFGPPPYFNGIYSPEKLWDINRWMMEYLKHELR